jgi:hypothetical protein
VEVKREEKENAACRKKGKAYCRENTIKEDG